jgi:hypothetical protein
LTFNTSPHREIFWGELAPFDRAFKSYEQDETYFGSLAMFVIRSLEFGESFLYIGSQQRMQQLEKALQKKKFETEFYFKSGQLTLVSTQETYKRFVLNGWPNDILFVEHLSRLIDETISPLTILSEAVAFMWELGNRGATLHLENLCRQFTRAEKINFACAYPESGFTQSPQVSLQYIIGAHNKTKEGVMI